MARIVTSRRRAAFARMGAAMRAHAAVTLALAAAGCSTSEYRARVHNVSESETIEIRLTSRDGSRQHAGLITGPGGALDYGGRLPREPRLTVRRWHDGAAIGPPLHLPLIEGGLVEAEVTVVSDRPVSLQTRLSRGAAVE